MASSNNVATPDKICHICGNAGNVEEIVTCSTCKIVSKHRYCIQKELHAIPELWRCEECAANRNGKNRKRKTIRLDDIESRKAANTINQWRPLTKRELRQARGNRKQVTRPCSPMRHDVPPRRELVPSSKLGVVSTPKISINIRTLTSPATPVIPAITTSQAPHLQNQGTNRAIPLAAGAAPTCNLAVEAKNTHSCETSGGQGLLKTQTKNAGPNALQNETIKNPSAGGRSSKRPNEPLCGELVPISRLGVVSAPNISEYIRTPISPATPVISATMASQAPHLRNQGTKRAASIPAGISSTSNIAVEGNNTHKCEASGKGKRLLKTQTENVEPNALQNETSKNPSAAGLLGHAFFKMQTENNGSSPQHNETTRNPSADDLSGSKPTDTQIQGCENTDTSLRLLFMFPGTPKYHPCPSAGWNGNFQILDTYNEKHELQGIRAHFPGVVSRKVYDTVTTLSGKDIRLTLFQRLDVWPNFFRVDPPELDDIGLYFFPSKEQRSKKLFTQIVDMMDEQDLAMQYSFGNGTELLIFTCAHLLQDPQVTGIVSEICLWGVFSRVKRKKKTAPDNKTLPDDAPIGSNGNNCPNQATGCSFQNRAKDTAIERMNGLNLGLNAPTAFSKPTYRNQTHRGRTRPQITYAALHNQSAHPPKRT